MKPLWVLYQHGRPGCDLAHRDSWSYSKSLDRHPVQDDSVKYGTGNEINMIMGIKLVNGRVFLNCEKGHKRGQYELYKADCESGN